VAFSQDEETDANTHHQTLSAVTNEGKERDQDGGIWTDALVD
jgi:hypothetical protein